MARRIFVKLLYAIAIIAGVVFIFAPFTTLTGLFLNASAVVVILGCFLALHALDDKNLGYWPAKTLSGTMSGTATAGSPSADSDPLKP